MEAAPHIIVASFDNRDPTAFGPFATYAEAQAALPKVNARYNADGDDSVTSVDIVQLRGIA